MLARSLAMKITTLAIFISLPVRAVSDLHAGAVMAGTDAQEGDAVAVVRVHVGLDLEHEAGERGLGRVRTHCALGRHRARSGAGAQSSSARSISRTPKLLMPEPKNTGVCLPARKSSQIERLRRRRAPVRLRRRMVSISIGHLLRAAASICAPRMISNSWPAFSSPGVKSRTSSLQQVVHALKALAHADRPGHRRALDLQHRFDLVQQFQRIAHFAVHLVDEGDDRRVAQAAHFEQLDGLLFHALGRIDHHHARNPRRSARGRCLRRNPGGRACRAG